MNVPSSSPAGRPELLAPAGNLEKLKAAVHYGADAVYAGGAGLSLRAHAVMDRDELAAAVAYAHAHGVRCYITVNIFAHNRDLDKLEDSLLFLRGLEVDALIVADPGVFSLARVLVPEIPLHVSTQANVTNHAAALFWQRQGAARVNLARELSGVEIEAIRRRTALELEVFVHGALCISYSGRCSLSLYLTGRNANHGNCAHPCRYRYALREEKRPGMSWPVEEDERGAYIFNSKDLCLLRRLPALTAMGVNSLKIEGRMKSVSYVGAVTRLYRTALDYLQAHPETDTLPARFFDELGKIGSRGYTENFFDGPPGAGDMLYHGIRPQQAFPPVGLVRANGLVEIRTPCAVGDAVEYLHRDGRNTALTIRALTTAAGEALKRANPGTLVRLSTVPEFGPWRQNALLRRAG